MLKEKWWKGGENRANIYAFCINASLVLAFFTRSQESVKTKARQVVETMRRSSESVKFALIE